MAKHPALFLALAFCGGFLCQQWLALSLFLSALLFCCTCCSALLLFIKTPNGSSLSNGFLLCAVMSAGMLHLARAKDVAPHDLIHWAQERREVTLLGEISERPEPRRDSWRAPVRVFALQTSDSLATRVRGRAFVYSRALRDLQIGERVILRGNLQLADEARNPGAFDYRAYLRANDLSALFFCADSVPLWKQSASARFTLPRLTARAAAWIEQCIAAFSSGQERALLEGLLLGQIDELDPALMESFARTGFIHVLSVSGLHVGFIALMLVLAASLLRLPSRKQWLLLLPALWFYAYLTGMKPPIVRATMMASVMIWGRAHEREASLPNDLSVAALLILCMQPLQFFQLGFQLSFLAMFGLAYINNPMLHLLARCKPWRALRWAVTLLAASLAAQLATLPMLVVHYGRLPLAALWGNLVVIPLSFLAVANTALACVCAPLSTFAMHAFGVVAELSAKIMLGFTQWLAHVPYSYVEGVYFPPLLLMFYVLVLALFVLHRQPIRARVLILALLVLNLHVWNEARHAAPRLRITFFDVGQGDAALLEFPQGERLLIDTGPWLGTTNAGARVLLPYFHRQGIRRLHGVVISHPHADHLGGLPALLAGLAIDTVYFGSAASDSELERHCKRLMDSLLVPSKRLQAGEGLLLASGARLAALCSEPRLPAPTNLNEASLVLKVLYGKIALLFPGDAERSNEEHMLEHARALDTDLLKVPHHGSKTSSTEDFLRAATPSWAVVSVGRYNNFAHPHAEVITRYQNLGIALTRTDESGAVMFETEGEKLKRVR